MHQMGTATYIALASRFREIREMDRERGLTTTEIAVLTFILVAVAVAVGAILFSYATEQANNLPTDPTAEFEIGGGDG